MSFSNWKYAYASVMGTSHVKANLPCQDYSLCEMLNEQTLCIVVSDGAGSAIYADKGAKIACKETLDALKEYFADENTIAEINRNFAEESRSRILKAIHNQADLKSCTIRDFACTLLVAVIGETMAVFWQVGDGAIVVYEPHPTTEYRLFFQPAKGEYANMTEFITQKDVMLQFEIRRGKVDEVAIISDGLECLALNLKEQEAFAPFSKVCLPLCVCKMMDTLNVLLSRYELCSILTVSIHEQTMIKHWCWQHVDARILKIG